MLKFAIFVVFLTYVYAEKSAIVYVFDPTGVSGVSGNITFTETDNGISVEGTLKGLAAGEHGFHVHELGNIGLGCDASGGHFNPHNATHGGPESSTRHVGDLGNIEVGSNGEASVKIIDKVIALDGEHSIIGRTVVVHEGKDDLGLGSNADSLITGNAGKRLACGVIGILSDSGANIVVKSNTMIMIAAVLALGLKSLF